MKKISFHAEGVEPFQTIYTDLPRYFDANYLITTAGDPITDNDISDAELDELLAELAAGYRWEEASDEDLDYVIGVAASWGIDYPDELTNEELAHAINHHSKWSHSHLEELCKRAGLMEEYKKGRSNAMDGCSYEDSFEYVVNQAAEILGVEI